MAEKLKWLVIINPTSGNGQAKRKWPKVKAVLQKEGFDFNFHFTEYPKHSYELIQESVSQGVRHFISVGGDGTLHNMVNGIMSQTICPSYDIKVGVIPIGTGNDWVKTYHIPKQIKEAVLVIKSNHELYQDIGKIDFIDRPSKPIYFNNLAGVGFDGYVVNKVGKYKHLGALAYLIGALIGMFKYQNHYVEISTGNTSMQFKSLMVLVGLCQFSGGGMQLTKEANPSDGLFDITLAKDLGKRDILMNLPKLFNGKITNHPKVTVMKTQSIGINTVNSAPYIQADGELIGQGGFSATVLKKALCFYGIKKPA